MIESDRGYFENHVIESDRGLNLKFFYDYILNHPLPFIKVIVGKEHQRVLLRRGMATMDIVLASRKWLENVAGGRPMKLKEMGQTVEPLALSGLEVVRSERGRFLCKFVVPKHLTVSVV